MIYNIYTFCKGLQGMDAEESGYFIRNHTHSRDLGKVKHSASRAGEEDLQEEMLQSRCSLAIQSFIWIA